MSLTIQLNISCLLNDWTVLFQPIHFSRSHCTQFKCQIVLLDSLIGPFQVLPLWTRVDLGLMAMKRVLHIPESSSITGASAFDFFLSYSRHSGEMQSVYSATQPTGFHHHHHIALVARISLTLSRHSSLSFIALGRSSGQHPVSSHSCWMYVRAGRPAFARPCVGIHKSTSLMSSSLLLQQCPACLVRLTWIVFVIGGRWPYSWCLVGCCRQDLFRIARSILV